MKSQVTVFFVFAVALVGVFAAPRSENSNGFYDYHRQIGIPQAEKIRIQEKEILENNSQNVNERLSGGGSTLIALVPYQAGLIIKVLFIYTSVCGAVVISDTRVLTAAHCYTDGATTAQSITVVLGSSFLFTGGTRLETTDVVLNPGYNPNIFANDLAILRTPRIIFSLNISPIALPSGSELNQDFNGYSATASGFGASRDGDTIGILQQVGSVNLVVISNAECQAAYGNVIQTQNLCTRGTGGVGICSGDLGGPLTVWNNWRTVLIGVGAFYANAGCSTGLPSGFTRVSEFVSWINSV